MDDSSFFEAADIATVLPLFEYNTIKNTLTEFSEENANRRIQLTLRKLYSMVDDNDDLFQQELDVQMLQKLFPQFTKKEIRGQVALIGNEINRKSIVCRLLLKKCEKQTKKEFKKRNCERDIEESGSGKRLKTCDTSLWLKTIDSTTDAPLTNRKSKNSVVNQDVASPSTSTAGVSNQHVSQVNFKMLRANTSSLLKHYDDAIDAVVAETKSMNDSVVQDVWPSTSKFDDGDHVLNQYSYYDPQINLAKYHSSPIKTPNTYNNSLNCDKMQISTVVNNYFKSKNNLLETAIPDLQKDMDSSIKEFDAVLEFITSSSTPSFKENMPSITRMNEENRKAENQTETDNGNCIAKERTVLKDKFSSIKVFVPERKVGVSRIPQIVSETKSTAENGTEKDNGNQSAEERTILKDKYKVFVPEGKVGISRIPQIVSETKHTAEKDNGNHSAEERTMLKSSTAEVLVLRVPQIGSETKSTAATEKFNLVTYLCNVTYRSEDVVTKAIQLHGLNPIRRPNEFELETVVLHLLEGGDQDPDVKIVEESLIEPPDVLIVSEEPVPGPSRKSNAQFLGEVEPKTSENRKLYYRLIEIFPDACPDYIDGLCSKRNYDMATIDELISDILSAPKYPTRKQKQVVDEETADPEQQYEILKQILPDADPSYLRLQLENFVGDSEKMKIFVSNALEEKKYPTMKEYLRKMQLSAQEKQYTSDFSVEKFVEVIPDPISYFKQENRKNTVTEDSFRFAVEFLKNRYNLLQINRICRIVMQMYKTQSLISICKNLDNEMATGTNIMRVKRKPKPWVGAVQNIPLLQEMAYITHKEEIEKYVEKKKALEKEEWEAARAAGCLLTCKCCYDEEVLRRNSTECDGGCIFCKECVRRSVDVAFGDGKLEFPCLAGCAAQFSLATLQVVLDPKLFSKVAQKKQMEEVKAAGIEDLESCPFCDFATIPALADKLFKCLNPECMKESCRLCKEPSHVPLRCEEVEKDEEVKARTYIEDKMTEALLRKCHKCGVKFIKFDGCNKMTCTCGAMMCYVCGKPVLDYKHFNGQGGDQYHLCPLYSDLDLLHRDAVIKGAEQAKIEIGVKNNPDKIKHDPAADINKFYKATKRTKHPQGHHQ